MRFRAVLLIVFLLSPLLTIADNYGVYIICSKLYKEDDDVVYNKEVGMAIQAFLNDKLKKENHTILPLNHLLAKHLVFEKFEQGFYINEKAIDSLGKTKGCAKTIIVHIGYGGKGKMAGQLKLYDKIHIYSVIANPEELKNKVYTRYTFKHYLKVKGLSQSKAAQGSRKIYLEFITEEAGRLTM